MDAAMINETSFSVAFDSSCSLAQIWPFPINGNGGVGEPNGGVLGLRMSNLSGFGKAASYCDVSVDESTVTEQSGSACAFVHLRGSRDEIGGSKSQVEASSEPGNKPSEPPKQDYIHISARRGQTTDSHSLAERARREKIGERMKILQDLVPGCNKEMKSLMVL